MARVPAFVAGLVCGLVLGTAVIVGHADDVSAEVSAAAATAHVDPVNVQAALDTMAQDGVATDAWSYLRSTGELPPLPPLPHETVRPPAPSDSPPAAPAVSARVACIEGKESQGRNIANQRGSGAVGVLQYLPSTFAAHAAELGHPEWSPWNPAQARAVAAHDLALGRRAQWSVGGC
jgi:hypothetical protein